MLPVSPLRAPESLLAYGGSCSVYDEGETVLKVMEDVCIEDAKREAEMQTLAARVGLAPELFSVYEYERASCIRMAKIDTSRYKQLDDKEERAILLGGRLFCRLLLSGVIHGDFHGDNWYHDGVHSLAIDFGMSQRFESANKEYLQRAAAELIKTLSCLGEVTPVLEHDRDMSHEEHRTWLTTNAQNILEWTSTL